MGLSSIYNGALLHMVGCDLCLTKKYIIARANKNNLLNKRFELISKCRHRNKYILKIYDKFELIYYETI